MNENVEVDEFKDDIINGEKMPIGESLFFRKKVPELLLTNWCFKDETRLKSEQQKSSLGIQISKKFENELFFDPNALANVGNRANFNIAKIMGEGVHLFPG